MTNQPPRFAPRRERTQYGKSLRAHLARGHQGMWQAGSLRADVVAQLKKASAGRIPELLPLKWGRMSASPFAFFRGAVAVMAGDLANLPVSGVTVQLCGDAHVRNLGAFAAPDGRMVFDLNDFDETVRGPWEWDLKRITTSIVLAGREAGHSSRRCGEAVQALVCAYRNALMRLARITMLELVGHEIKRRFTGPVHALLRKAERSTPRELLTKLTLTDDSNRRRRFVHRPPLLRRVEGEVAQVVLGALTDYRATLDPAHQLTLDAYRPVDVAFKVVGTGSVGTHDYVVLFLGDGTEDALLLQIKEALAPSYPSLSDPPATGGHQGRRVALGQRCMQTATDPFLGWTAFAGRQYLVRQLADHKASIDVQTLRHGALLEYARVCGEILAKAHARTGDPAILAGYAGRSDRLDRALAGFALRYADQVTRDFAQFTQAIQQGHLEARRPE